LLQDPHLKAILTGLRYEVDEVKTTDQINPFLASAEVTKSKIYAIQDQVSDDITFLSFDASNMTVLKTAIEECRVIKTPFEIDLIRYANRVSTAGHTALMKASKTAQNERDLVGIFLKESMTRHCPEQSYPPIMASGRNAATLHYPQNDANLAGKQLVLVDAGAEYSCYASDITRTWPLGGDFSPEGRKLYELVLTMQKETIPMLKEGVNWDDVHAHAHKVAIKGLLDMGILKGDAEEIFQARTSVAFFPHGLGHYLGMDTHDTGGYPNYKDEDPMFRYLRKRGTLPAGSVITVEPGVYFCRFIIEPYLKSEKHSKFIDEAVLDKYWDVGGVRIEGE
jgi:Xaa-Pro dipeptidase